MRRKAPLLSSVIETALVKSGDDRAKTMCKVGTVLGLIMHGNAPSRNKYLQSAVSLQMWRSGCNTHLFKCLNSMGFCMSRNTTRKLVDAVIDNYDQKIKVWRDDVQRNLYRSVPDGYLGEDGISTIIYASEVESVDTDATIAYMNESADETPSEGALPKSYPEYTNEPSNSHPGYSLCWDNVQIMVQRRHQGLQGCNEFRIWALAYAAQNRIPQPVVPGVSGSIKQAQTLPISAFLASYDDVQELRTRMETIVKRILCQNLPFFKEKYNDCVTEHLPHRFSEQTSMKSDIVNLGVLDDNPASTAGVISILQKLHKYVPQRGGKLHTIVCHGDGMSVERHVDAKRARAGSCTAEGRLEGLEPSPQEFHKCLLLMQDTMKTFFKGSSAGDRGTLFHIKNVFNHKNVGFNCNELFNHNDDFLRFVCEGLTCLLAMEECGMASPDDEPTANANTTKSERERFFCRLAGNIVDAIWEDPIDIVDQILSSRSPEVEDDDFEYCLCQSIYGGTTMVQCSNNGCENGRWFHVECVNIDDATSITGDWWCSDECKGASIFCICKKSSDTPSVQCANRSNCQYGKHFHLDCVGLTEPPVGKWFCSWHCQEHVSKATDSVCEYTKALLWTLLNDRVRHDAVREGDGDAMISYWKLDLPRFFKRGHNKYTILGHRLIAGTSGVLPDRIAHDLKWNRTVNMAGGPGKNLEMDLVNEFLNRDFKENLKLSRGRYTDQQVARSSHMVGPYGRHLDKVFEITVADTYSQRSHAKQPFSYAKDVRALLEEYNTDRLFRSIPGRNHSAFPDFNHTNEVKDGWKLRQRLNKYSKKLDTANNIV